MGSLLFKGPSVSCHHEGSGLLGNNNIVGLHQRGESGPSSVLLRTADQLVCVQEMTWREELCKAMIEAYREWCFFEQHRLTWEHTLASFKITTLDRDYLSNMGTLRTIRLRDSNVTIDVFSPY